MAVYVDEAEWEWRGAMWCHLLADSLDELHAFADKLALRRSWFQKPPKTKYPHYDITETKRFQALRLGAIPIDQKKKTIELARALRAEFDLLVECEKAGDAKKA